jgi:SAM-dependent methyltransferase
MRCWLCGTESSTVLTEHLRRGPGRVFHCASCDLGILEAKLGADLSSYYAEEYWKSHGPDLTRQTGYEEIFEAYVNYQQRRLDLLRPHLRPDVRLLEVGCATGHFLFNAKPLVAEVVGVDYDVGAAAYAGRRCDCKTFGGALADAGLAPASFEVVCAFQTLEHVTDPVGFVAELGRYLNPHGKLVIEVPNLGDPLRALYDVPSYRAFYYHSEHTHYFSPKSLRAVAEQAGFAGEVHFVQDYNFTNHMNWLFTGKPQATCHEGLGLPRVALNVGLSPSARVAVNRWLEEIDRSYKRLLADLQLTENITFIGQRAGDAQ